MKKPLEKLNFCSRLYCTFFHYWQQADFFNIFVVVKVNFLRVLKSNQDIFPTFNMWTVKPPKRDFVKQEAAASCKHPKFISFFVICTYPRMKKNPLWCSMNWGLNLANLAYLWIWKSFQIRSRLKMLTKFEPQTFLWYCTSWLRISPFGGIKERSNKMVPIPLKNFFACSVLLCSSYLLWTIDLAFFRTPHPLGVGPIFPRQCCNAMYVHATQVYFFATTCLMSDRRRRTPKGQNSI